MALSVLKLLSMLNINSKDYRQVANRAFSFSSKLAEVYL